MHCNGYQFTLCLLPLMHLCFNGRSRRLVKYTSFTGVGAIKGVHEIFEGHMNGVSFCLITYDLSLLTLLYCYDYVFPPPLHGIRFHGEWCSFTFQWILSMKFDTCHVAGLRICRWARVDPWRVSSLALQVEKFPARFFVRAVLKQKVSMNFLCGFVFLWVVVNLIFKYTNRVFFSLDFASYCPLCFCPFCLKFCAILSGRGGSWFIFATIAEVEMFRFRAASPLSKQEILLLDQPGGLQVHRYPPSDEELLHT